jgi:site-specific DNA-methyltransferase (adenine-specific)
MDEYLNKIICGDCLDVMRKLPDKCVDLVLTDPPYGTKTDQRGDSFMIGEFSNVLPLVLPELHRILKDDGAFYCFTSWTQMPEWLLRFQQYFKLQNILVWDKQRHSGCYSPSSWQFTWEGIYFGIKGKRKIRKYQRDVLISTEKGKRVAMQKPVDVLEKIIEASTDENMVVLDPFLGSGSTAVACKQLNRNFIGIEISEEYCKIAQERLNNLQPSLI